MSEEPTRHLPTDDLKLILAHLESINTRLSTLEEKVDRRLQETRPIWEQVLARLDSVENRMQSLENGMQALKDEVHIGFRKLERQIAVLATDVIEVRGYQHDLERRMDKLEP